MLFYDLVFLTIEFVDVTNLIRFPFDVDTIG